ncbi:hypothetical protein [Marinobacter sp.]|uniref:hypothetical protein n=1 Tax=Marinobacter sp. TaxID=50741 RepID=UPI002B266E69|nr:hypothetical protein [Marinobacter sp.]
MINRQRMVVFVLAAGMNVVTLTTQADTVFMTEPLTDSELAAQRGGFLLDNLEISIGLEQIISVNGETLAVNRLTIPNLNQAGNGGGVPHELETMIGMVNSGVNGQALVAASSTPGGWMTLIQNDLNGSVIQNARLLNIELNNLGSGYRLPDQVQAPILQFLGR